MGETALKPLRSGVTVAVALAVSASGFVGVARAEPIVDFSTGAPVGTAVFDIAPGDAGSMWFVESTTGEGDEYEVAEMNSSGSITTSVQLTTPNKEQGSTGMDVSLAPAADGGVWALQSESIVHISPTGNVEPITLPLGAVGIYSVSSGDDGNAWALACRPIFRPEEVSETCEALKIELNGHVDAYPLPSFSHTFPVADEGENDYGSPPGFTFPVAGGVWMDRPTASSADGRLWEAAFVTYKGQVAPAPIPTNARLVAAASEDNAWWQEPAENDPPTTSTVTFGQLMPGGTSAAVSVHAQETGEPDGAASASVDPGPNGTLIWAERTPWSNAHTGFIGTISTTGERGTPWNR